MKLYKDKNPDYSAYLSKTWGIPTEVVKKETVNGGWFHGMNLGGQTLLKDSEGNPLWQIMC